MKFKITKVFLWTSPVAFALFIAVNFPDIEKIIWTSSMVAPILGILFAVWLLSFLFVTFTTIINPNQKENPLHNVVLSEERDEREALISGQAAKKSILITLAASLLLLICTTGLYTESETTGKSSLTIGHFRLTDWSPLVSPSKAKASIVHQLPMSKTSLILLIIMIQLVSYHSLNFINLKKTES